MTKDPEIRVNQEQKNIGRFTIAVNRNKKEADFINCVALDRKAELLEKYFRKGDRIGVVGRIQTGSYTNRDGQKVYTTDIFVEEIEFLQDKKKEEKEDEVFLPVDDEELPF